MPRRVIHSSSRRLGHRPLSVESLESRALLSATSDLADLAPPAEVLALEVGPADVDMGPLAAPAGLHQAPQAVVVPAGSDDALADAIADAGRGGTVILAGGMHTESTTVVVGFPVSIVGEPGAILQGSTTPIDPYARAVLSIRGADRVLIEGITFEDSDNLGNTAILVESSDHVTIRGNVVRDHFFGIIVHSGDHATIFGNHVTGLPGERAGLGITNINGSHTRIAHNDVEGFDTGVFLSGAKGHMQFNSLSGNIVGVLLCTFDAGNPRGAELPATRWHVSNNVAYGNQVGYVVTDFSTNNFLVNNEAFDNADADIILDGGLFPSFDTLVALGSHKTLEVIDMGINNRVN